MAASQYYEQIQQAYLAYYGRPADPAGQAYWAQQLDNAGGNLSAIINAFGTSAESTALYGGSSAAAQVNAIYEQLFGRQADVTGLNFYVNGLENGQFTLASIALNVFNGAQNSDLAELQAKEAYADAFTSAVGESVSAQIAYSGTAASNAARAAVSGVTSTATEATAVSALPTTIANIGSGAVGQTVTLTTGVDNITLTGNNNIVNAVPTSTGANTLTPLDSISGTGTGNTLNIVDGTAVTPESSYYYSLPNAVTINDIATVNLTTQAGVYINTGSSDSDAGPETSISGLTTLNVTAADIDSEGVYVGAADTTNVNVTTATTNEVDIYGGAVVTVNATAANDVYLYGAGQTAVTVTAGDTYVYIENDSATGVNDGKGTTLTAVTLNGLTDEAYIEGNAIANVTLANVTDYADVEIDDHATGAQSLTLNLSNVGYSASGSSQYVTIDDENGTFTTLNVVATGKDDVYLETGAVTSLTISGTGSVVIESNSTFGALTSVDASTNSGGVTFTDNAAGATITGGSGNDVVYLEAALTSGASINLGAGNNQLLSDGGSIGTGVTVNGGTGGINTISASLVNAGDAADISNFQVLDVSGFGATTGSGALDASLLTGSTISGVSITTAKTAGLATLENLASAVTVTDTLDATAGVFGTNSALTLTHAGTGTDSLAINFAETATASANVETIDSMTSTGDSTIAITSGGASTHTGFGNAITSLVETDNHLTTITITGSQAFSLGVGIGGTVATDTGLAATSSVTTTASSLTLINGSAATGALDIVAGASTSPSVDNLVTYKGLAIDGGIGGDTITNYAASGVITEGATASTLVNTLTLGATAAGGSIHDAASAGADVINLDGYGNSATLGSGTGVSVTVANDTFGTGGTAPLFGDVSTVTFGSGTATVADYLAYNVTATPTSSATNGDLLVLNGSLTGNSVTFGTAPGYSDTVSFSGTTGTALGTATSVSTAQTFDQAVYHALSATANTVTWFQYGGNTYVEDSGPLVGSGTSVTTTATAEVVKITGTVDLSHATVQHSIPAP